MKKVIPFLLLCFVFGLNGIAQNSMSYKYIGTNWDKFEGHTVDIVGMDTTVARVTTLIDKFTIKNGEFDVSGALSTYRNAIIGLYTPNGDFVWKQDFILEPGTIMLTFDSTSNKAVIDGGKYNELILGMNQHDEELVAKQKALSEFRASQTQASFKEDKVRKRFQELNEDVKAHKDLIFLKLWTKPDSIAKLLAFSKRGFAAKFENDLNALEQQFGKDHPELYYARYVYKRSKSRNQMVQTVGIGSQIKDFSSKNIENKEFKLSDVLKKNEYVLVEFWASWCAPCRAEIPHMKKAYENFKNKGFEIVSFTLDHERDRWEKASVEENLPWINVGDLLATKSPVVKMYGVNGVPANFLVYKTGKIIAVNLRQSALDDKLIELLNN